MPQSPHTIATDRMREVGAIVLGGGRGTRLFPLTALRAKPAVPLCGRYRLVDIPLSNCIHSGIKRAVVLTQFNSHSLNRHINQTYKFDAFSNGYVEVLSAEQTQSGGEWFQGTADAVRKQLIHIKNMGARYYLILSGDQLYRMDYRAMLRTHLSKGADITVAALPVNRKSAQAFGIMKVLSNTRIRQFVEKPTAKKTLDALVTPDKVFSEFGLAAEGKSFLASMGVYIFNAPVLEDLLLKHPDWIDFGKELIPGALKTHRVFAHMFDGFWEDIGTVRSYFDVSMAMTRPDSPFQFHDEHHLIYTHSRALPGTSINDARIRNTILCEGSRITQASVTDCIIGVRSIVQPGAELSESIILGAEYFEDSATPKGLPRMGIGPKAKISRAIIDHNARIGAGVVIRGSDELPDSDGDGYAIRDGVVVVLKNAVIPDGARIG